MKTVLCAEEPAPSRRGASELNRGLHTFAAFITQPGGALPPAGAGLASNEVSVTWLGISLASDSTLDGDRLREMAKASASIGRRDAAQRVLRVLREVSRS